MIDSDDLWVASTPLPSVTIADELARRGPIPPAEAARWGFDVAEGLAAVPAAGVAHRNLHAGLVGIAEDGHTVVGGFATTVVARDGLRSGTPVHVAPEAIQGAQPAAVSPQLAGSLSDLLKRMLRLDPAQRPDAAAVAGELRQIAARQGRQIRQSPGPLRSGGIGRGG